MQQYEIATKAAEYEWLYPLFSAVRCSASVTVLCRLGVFVGAT